MADICLMQSKCQLLGLTSHCVGTEYLDNVSTYRSHCFLQQPLKRSQKITRGKYTTHDLK